ncbi:phytanoyl-CoA dioxygenase family protein [Rhizobacter sp. P5_C2]
MTPNGFEKTGCVVVPAVLPAGDCDALADLVEALGSGGAGTRSLLSQPWCAALAQRLRQHRVLSGLMPAGLVAVQCTFFEKSASLNWLVPVHQDLGIPVSERIDHPALRAWSEKEGALFVQPPVDFLGQLIAVRVHLDPCTAQDGPLRVIPGTHRLGHIRDDDAIALRTRGPEITLCAAKGDALVIRPLLLHASSKATGTSRRRVLHFLFGPTQPPHGLRWQHAA